MGAVLRAYVVIIEENPIIILFNLLEKLGQLRTLSEICRYLRNNWNKRYFEQYQKDWETGSQNAEFVGEAKESLLSVKVRAVILGEKSILFENESSENSKSYQCSTFSARVS